MIALLCFFMTLFASLFKSKGRLEAENATLRHQLIVLRRRVRGRARQCEQLENSRPLPGTMRLAVAFTNKLEAGDGVSLCQR